MYFFFQKKTSIVLNDNSLLRLIPLFYHRQNKRLVFMHRTRLLCARQLDREIATPLQKINLDCMSFALNCRNRCQRLQSYY